MITPQVAEIVDKTIRMWNKADDAGIGNWHAVHGKEAGIENTGNEHIVKRRQQRAAQVNHPALGVIILAIENIAER